MTDEGQQMLQEFFHGYNYQSAGYTYLANYIWRRTYALWWEEIEGYLCIAGAGCFAEHPHAVMFMPLTKDGEYIPEKLGACLQEAKKRFDDAGIPFVLRQIPEHMTGFLQESCRGEIRFFHNRDMDEYVYEKEKLIKLSGRALHRKKNHLNYFLRNYEFEVRELTEEMYTDVIALTKKVEEERSYSDEERESLEEEKAAIREMMKFLHQDDVYGRAIYIGGEMEAFAIGERLWKDSAVEHFEKANDHFRGIYQVICSEFCRSLPEEVLFVNREEDMGIEGLRHAKEALKPHHLLKMYRGEWEE